MVRVTPTVDIFTSLRGQWLIKRSLKSEPGYGLSGELVGTATFVPRKPTAQSTALELLYHEQGDLKTHNGLTLKASRKYVYRYSEDDDKISVWFVKEDTKDKTGKEEVDNLFMELDISKHEGTTIGRGDHLCSKDMYWAEYQWRMPEVKDDEEEGEDMDIWGLRYKVKGKLEEHYKAL